MSRNYQYIQCGPNLIMSTFSVQNIESWMFWPTIPCNTNNQESWWRVKNRILTIDGASERRTCWNKSTGPPISWLQAVLFPPWGPPGRFLYGARCFVSCTMLCPHHHVPHAAICEAALLSAWRCLFTARTAGGASFHLPSRGLLIVWPSKLPPECSFLFKSENRMLFREQEWIDGWIFSKTWAKTTTLHVFRHAVWLGHNH